VLNSFKLRQTVSGMPIGVMTIDGHNDWQVDYLNPALADLLAASGMKTDIVGVKASAILGAAGVDDHRLGTLPAEGFRAALKQGERIFALTFASILAPDGTRQGAMVAWEDVSERQALATRFESTVKGVVASVQRMSDELRSHARTVRTSAAATLVQAEGVARSSEENSASVTTVASAAEQLAASVEEIANQISQSTEISQEAAEQSRLMVDVVRDLQEAASRIGVVVQLIGNIASQTNLLALNATIEAARAGEAGRGFAVVASEVKGLASQTAGAAEEVVTQVAGIQSKTGEAVTAIERINSIVDTISRLSTGVAAAVEQQRNATGEIARNTQQTASGTHEVAQTITHVSAATQETEQASQAMLTQADQLQTMIDGLNREVDAFLQSLAA
jgi:methyl-accepting chemotaxis protein